MGFVILYKGCFWILFPTEFRGHRKIPKDRRFTHWTDRFLNFQNWWILNIQTKVKIWILLDTDFKYLLFFSVFVVYEESNKSFQKSKPISHSRGRIIALSLRDYRKGFRVISFSYNKRSFRFRIFVGTGPFFLRQSFFYRPSTICFLSTENKHKSRKLLF